MKQRPAQLIDRGILAFIVALLSFFYFARYCDNALLSSDPVDYIAAASRGFSTLYLNSGSVTPWDLYTLTRGEAKVGAHIWDYLERRRDPVSDRHFHVPFGFYPYALAAGAGGREYAQRLLTAAEGAFIIGLTFFGLVSAGTGALLSLATVILMALSPSIVSTFTDPSPHTLFLGLTVAFGFLLGKYLSSSVNRMRYISSAAILLATLIATLELSIVVAVAATMVVAERAWRGSRVIFRDLARAAPWFLAALLIVWPGGVIRGGYVVSYGAFLFQALFRRADYFGSAAFSDVVMRGCEMSVPVLIVSVGLLAATAGLVVMRKSTPYLNVFIWLTLGFACQGLLNRFHNTTYAAHFSALRWILLALCAQQWLNSTKGWRVRGLTSSALILAGVGAVHWPAASQSVKNERDTFSNRAAEVIGYVHAHLPPGSAIVTNTERGIWRYYLPAYRIEPSQGFGNLTPEPQARLDEYWAIADPRTLNPDWRKAVTIESGAPVAGFEIYKCRLLP